MGEICSTCGLPKELCVCETIAKENQTIQIKTTKRKFGKIYTIIEGIDDKYIDIKDLTKQLKSKFACGGTLKGNTIELQGNHKAKVMDALVGIGFAAETIELK